MIQLYFNHVPSSKVNILRQNFFIYDMDEFTRRFHHEVLGQEQLESIAVDKLAPPTVPLQVIGFVFVH